MKDSNAAVVVNVTIFEQLCALASSSGSTLPSPSLYRWSASYIIFTSGSTGKPKGVVNTVGGIVNRLMWMQSEVSITANDVLVQKTNPMFDVSMWEILLPFAVGGRLTLLEYQMEKDFEATSKRLARHEVTIVHFVPSVLSAMLVVPEDCIWATPLGAVRSVICSGEALGTAVLIDLEAMQFPGTVINLYGPTEAAVDVTILHDAIGVAAKLGCVPIGSTVWNTTLSIQPAQWTKRDVHLPFGGLGELVLVGVQVARGYVGRPGLMASRFIAWPHGARAYRTGDCCRWMQSPTGPVVEYIGRLDAQVKLHGYRIELGEITATLCKVFPFASNAATLVINNRLGSFASGLESDMLSAASWKDQFRRSVPSYMVPETIVLVDEWPLTRSGKTDLRRLEQESF